MTATLPETPTRWLRPAEAAETFGVCTDTLKAWAAAGRITATRTPGGHRRYLEADLRAAFGRCVR